MKHKSAIMGFSYLTGLICASFLSFAAAYLFCTAFIILAVLLFQFKKKIPEAVPAATLVIGIGFGVFGIYNQIFCEPVLNLNGQSHEITSTVIKKSTPSNDMAGYVLETKLNGITTQISLYGSDCDADYGDKLIFKGKLNTFKDNTVFSEESYYSSKGILLKVTAQSDIIVEKTQNHSFSYYIYEFNDYIKSEIMRVMPGDSGGLLCAVFLGDSSNLSTDLKENIKRAGISHYASVSGLHMTIITHIFMLFINLTPLKKKTRLKFILLAADITMFVFFFKLSTSVIRSGIMLLIYYCGSLFKRKGSTVNSLGFALLCILIFSPYACRDSGLLLSITGTFGIGVVSPVICNKFKSNKLNSIRELLIGTVCANFCTLPLTAVFFKGFSVVSPISNIVLQLFFMFALVAMIIFMLFGGFLTLPLFIAGIMSKLMVFTINILGNLKYSYVPLEYNFILPWSGLAALFMLVIYRIFKSISYTIKSAVITVFTLIGLISTHNFLSIGDMEIAIYSDGKTGVVAVKSYPDCVIISTGDSVEAAAFSKSFLRNNFIENASFLCILENSKNSMKFFEEIPSDIFITPNAEKASFDINDKLKIYYENNEAIIDYSGYIINVTSVKTVSKASDLLILYDYKMKIPDEILSECKKIIYVDKKMNAENPNEKNAFYDKVLLNYLIE